MTPGKKTYFLCRNNPCKGKVSAMLLRNFQLTMREKYDTFYTVYFQNQEIQSFFYSMPGSGEDTSKLENSHAFFFGIFVMIFVIFFFWKIQKQIFLGLTDSFIHSLSQYFFDRAKDVWCVIWNMIRTKFSLFFCIIWLHSSNSIFIALLQWVEELWDLLKWRKLFWNKSPLLQDSPSRLRLLNTPIMDANWWTLLSTMTYCLR